MKVRTIAAVSGLALLGLLIPAPAYAATGSISVTTGPAILQPAPDGGYSGQMPIHITSHGNTAGKQVNVTMAVPVGLSATFGPDTAFGGCGLGTDAQGRRILFCVLFGQLLNNQTLHTSIGFTSLAAPTRKTRMTGAGTITVDIPGETDPSPANNTSTFRGMLTGTGPGTDPHVYTPATQGGLSIATGPVTWTDNGDGTFTAAVPATLAASTDAVHEYILIRIIDQPAEFQFMTVEPAQVCFLFTCENPKMPQNTVRSITLRLTFTARPAPGSTATLTVAENGADGLPLPELTPADNAAVVPLD